MSRELVGGSSRDFRQDGSSLEILVPSSGPDQVAQERVHSAIYGDDKPSSAAIDWPVTCQVKIIMQDNAPFWTLISLDCNGDPKSVGGDEYYIAFTANENNTGTENTEDIMDEAQEEKIKIMNYSKTDAATAYSAVALIRDQQDGTYHLQFCATPTGQIPSSLTCGGILTIFFQYTCGIGCMSPPTKQGWVNGGYTHRKFDVPLAKGPTVISPFVHPNHLIMGPNNDTAISQRHYVALQQFDLIVVFGDSTMEQLVRQRPNKKGKYYFQSNVSFGPKVAVPLNSQTLPQLLTTLEESRGDQLRNSQQFPRRALMVGSAMWDILHSKDTLQGEMYEDHAQACRDYVLALQERYPGVALLWKSPTAVHIHVVDLERLVVSKLGEAALFGIERIRYMSSSRSQTLYQLQKRVIQEVSISSPTGSIYFLDLYQASYLSADWLFPSDGRHYRPDLNRLMLQWFYPFNHDRALADDNMKVSCDDKGGKLLNIAKPYYVDPTAILHEV